MKLSERDQIADEDINDQCYIHVVKPGIPKTSWRMKLSQYFTGWIKQSLNISESDFKNLTSLNDDYGYKIFEAPGENILDQLQNVILDIYGSLVSETPDRQFYLYAVYDKGGENEEYFIIGASENVDISKPRTLIIPIGVKNALLSSSTVGYKSNCEVYLYCFGGSLESFDPLLDGAGAKLIFETKKLTL